MKIFLKVFGQSFVTAFSRVATWIILFSCIAMNAIFIVMVPTLLKNSANYDPINDSWMIDIMSHMIGIVTIGFFASVLGEIIANPSDRIFILARRVKRESYLAAKILVSVLVACVLASIASILYYDLDRTHEVIPNMPDVNVQVWKLSLTMFSLGIFGACCGTTMRYYLREMLISVVILVITLSYAVSFSFINNDIADVKIVNDWQFLKIPLYVFLPLTTGVLITGFILNHKVDISA